MAFSQQEEEILDTLKELGPASGLQLRRALDWHMARLHPLLAGLRDRGVIRERTEAEYPHTTYYEKI